MKIEKCATKCSFGYKMLFDQLLTYFLSFQRFRLIQYVVSPYLQVNLVAILLQVLPQIMISICMLNLPQIKIFTKIDTIQFTQQI